MIEDPTFVRPGTTWYRDGELFDVIDIGNDIQVKAPSDANWHHAVVYKSQNEDTRRVRSVVDFCQKFSPEPTIEEDEPVEEES